MVRSRRTANGSDGEDEVEDDHGEEEEEEEEGDEDDCDDDDDGDDSGLREGGMASWKSATPVESMRGPVRHRSRATSRRTLSEVALICADKTSLDTAAT
jgi:hypothetical protein